MVTFFYDDILHSYTKKMLEIAYPRPILTVFETFDHLNVVGHRNIM